MRVRRGGGGWEGVKIQRRLTVEEVHQIEAIDGIERAARAEM